MEEILRKGATERDVIDQHLRSDIVLTFTNCRQSSGFKNGIFVNQIRNYGNVYPGEEFSSKIGVAHFLFISKQ